MSKDLQSDLLKEVTIDGITLQIDGYYDENTPEGQYEWYDVFWDGTCVNEGDPYWEFPTEEELLKLVTILNNEFMGDD